MEQRSQVRESEDRQSLERSLVGEVERLQRELVQATQSAEMSTQCSESLKREVSAVTMSSPCISHVAQHMLVISGLKMEAVCSCETQANTAQVHVTQKTRV
jgi:hypothetical protein